MPDGVEVSLPEWFQVVAVATLVLGFVLVPLTLLTPTPAWVTVRAAQVAAARATATALAEISDDGAGTPMPDGTPSTEGAIGVIGATPDNQLAPEHVAATATAAAIVVEAIGPGIVAGTVYDALNGEVLRGVRIEVQALQRFATSNAQGRYSLQGVPAGRHTLSVTRAGYIPYSEAVEVPAGGVGGIGFAISPALQEGQYRIVLHWGESPKDLDAHLWFPQNRPNHIYHPLAQRNSLDGSARLDVDARNGNGTETITVDRFFEGTYVYAVNQFSSDGVLAGANPRVTVYSSTGALHTFTPPQGQGRWWTVFTIDGNNREIKPVNTIGTASPGSY